MKPYALLLLLLLSSCSRNYVDVAFVNVHPRDLASCHVRTPDPRKVCPSVGQKLYVSWGLPKANPCSATLHVYIRYGNGEQEHIEEPLDAKGGSLTICLLNDDYFCKCGFESCYVEILGNGGPLACWSHHLWEERLDL